MEIERKYLIKSSAPDLQGFKAFDIIQGYISFSPTIRLRKQNDSYFLTVKSSGLLEREEFELPISHESFENLWKKIESYPVEKIRYLIPLENGLTAELDVYKNDLEPLRTVEVEFESVEASEAFIPPEWFAEEVTFDHRYKNGNIARNRLNDIKI